MILVVTLYAVLFCIAAFAPLRWSIVAYLLLATIDFPGDRSGVGMLNAAKGIVLPVYLLWRLRGYSGHRAITLAPVAWILLTLYAAVSAFWSFYPLPSVKLIGDMTGSLVICFVLIRATKGGYLTPRVVIPTTIGSISLAVLCRVFQPGWGDEKTRFSAFTAAQGFAAFLAVLYCIALCSKTMRLSVRIPLCAALIGALVLNGSRIWFVGIGIATLTALLISGTRTWIKICASGLMLILIAVLIGGSSTVVAVLGRDAASNRIAAAATAIYEGDMTGAGLGTFRFRRNLTTRVVENLKASTVEEMIFGHGTCNGAAIPGLHFKGLDPNRFFHDEWLRVTYEWGAVGLLLWFLFFGSIAAFAVTCVRRDRRGYAQPLLAYLPAFLVALAGENFIAAAGNSVNMGFLLLIALASVAYRAPQEAARQSVITQRSSRPLELAGAGIR